MSKKRSNPDPDGAHGGKILVKSRAYGKHFRAKRGTHKKAKLNAAFKKQSKQLVSANRPSKLFKDAIARYRNGLEGGPLWSELISTFNQQLDKYGAFDFSKLEPFEVKPDYPLGRFLNLQVRIKVNEAKSELNISASYHRHTKFPRSRFIDGYKVTVIGVFPDLEKNTAKTVAIESEVMGTKGMADPLKVNLKIPKNAKSFVLCMKIEGCREGKINSTPATMGMRMVKAGLI